MTFVLIISDVEHGVFNKSAVLMHYCVPVFLDPVLTCKQPLTRLELAEDPSRPAVLSQPSEISSTQSVPQVLTLATPTKRVAKVLM